MISLLVDFFYGSSRTIPVPREGGWRVDRDRGLLVIGHGVPRRELPLSNIRGWEIQRTEEPSMGVEYVPSMAIAEWRAEQTRATSYHRSAQPSLLDARAISGRWIHVSSGAACFVDGAGSTKNLEKLQQKP